MVSSSTIFHMEAQTVGFYGAGNFKAAQKDVLYLERGPERYALAWRVSSAFSATDGEDTLNQHADMSLAESRTAVDGLQTQSPPF